MEVTESDKHFNVLRYSIYYDRKRFTVQALWSTNFEKCVILFFQVQNGGDERGSSHRHQGVKLILLRR